MLVQLVDDRAVDVRAVLGAGHRSDRLEVRATALVKNLVLQRQHVLLQRGRRLGELLDRLEYEPGLLLRRRRGDDLGALLPIRARHVDRQAASQRALTVLARHVHVQLSHDPHVAAGVLIPADPSEDGRQDVGHLPGVRLQRLASPLALCMPQVRERAQHPVDALRVEHRARSLARGGRLNQRRAVGERDAAVLQVPGDLRSQLQLLQDRPLHTRSRSPTRTGCRPRRHRRPPSRGPAP